jgi:Cytochrome c7 and related cytochrome c
MIRPRIIAKRLTLPLAVILASALAAFGQGSAPTANGQSPPAAKTTPVSVSAGKKAATGPLFGPEHEPYVHAIHMDKLGSLECSLCHTAEKDGSVELKRPGHEQCTACHSDDFDNNYAKARATVCGACHSSTTNRSKADVLAFPRYKGTRAILFRFSHAGHVDKKARRDPATGFRADCTFCHKFDPQGIFAKFPGHTECATCHSKPGVTPQLTAALDATGCSGCHTPQEIENPGFTEQRRLITQTAVSGKYIDIKFTHVAHFAAKEKFNLDCTTCHYAVPRSTSLANLTLPSMTDCVACHDTSKAIRAEARMSNCQTCHADTVNGLFTPASHTRNIKPVSHNEGFRFHHEEAASSPEGNCYVCHQNFTSSVSGANQCTACHQVMRPASHTARWKEDIHGKYAGADRASCATCHQADYCVRCHNELPRSHEPLPVFAGGAHATLALLDTRACFTCHTFQNTCSECHTNQLTPRATPKH